MVMRQFCGGSCTTLEDALETVGGLVQCELCLNKPITKKKRKKEMKTCLINSVYH